MKAQPSKLMKSLLQNGVYGVTAVAALAVTGDALAQIASTRHNLTSTGSGSNRTSNTTEICVFCHTPHAADISVAGAPLWNRRLPTSTTFTVYSSSTMDAATGAQPGGVSLACLSCHDGTQAFDVMINAPGTGGYNSSGASQSYTFSGTNQLSGATRVQNLGTDLSNDHPIGIVYCGGTWVASAASATCGDADFRTPTKIDNTKWYVDSGTRGTNGTKDKTDPVLYYSGSTTNQMRVECGSCHDPHVAPKGTGQVAFLRVDQTGSGLCLTCHTK
jgi:predicted CXXCH cytochrome family protein